MTDIIIIEDDEEIAALTRDFLIKDGYTCKVFSSGENGLNWLREHSARLVLLDIILPGMDGFSVCDEIHRKMNLPLIIVSARDRKEDKLSGLRLGADDYIEKPFDIDILRAKIAALYRRHYGEHPLGAELSAGALTMDTAARTVVFDGKTLELTAKEYDLLVYLCEHQGKALRKDTLLNAVWGADNFSEPSTLTVHIKRLRDKIEKDTQNPKHILTVWGIGYKYEK
jgi:DNA-binding response OmpR family regulator